MGINDLLVEINYLAERINEAVTILIPINEYIVKVEKNINENAGFDLFPLEDVLNREYSIDLFVVNLEDKVQFILGQPKIAKLLVQLSEDIEKIRID